MRTPARLNHFSLLVPVALLAACDTGGGLATDKAGDLDTGADGTTDDVAPGDDGDDTAPTGEVEDELMLRPAQTDVYVFVASPERDTVTRIDVFTQAARTVRVGARPEVVVTTPDYATAIALNVDDDTVSVIDADTLAVDTVAVRDNLNALSLSPTGAWAVVWHDASRADETGPTGGAASFREVSVLDVAGRAQWPLVVGFTPKGVRFTPDGSVALLYADASLAILDLTGPTPEPTYIPIADPLDPPVVEEVVIDADARFAFLRQRGVDVLTLVDLVTGDVDTVAVGQDPTDLDLTPDGLGAVVVSRVAREVSVFSVADPFEAPRVVPFPDDTPFGSVLLGSDDLAILFTNATATDRFATWQLSGDDIDLHPLAKPPVSISRTPTGGSLLVVHDASNNPDGSTPAPYRDAPAVSLVDLDDFRSNTIRLAAPISGFANSLDGKRGYVVLEEQPWLEVLDYTTLIYDEVPLRSDAVFVGVLPDLDLTDGDQPPAWVSQVHPLGRMSFVDPDDDGTRTITGFELNAEIEE